MKEPDIIKVCAIQLGLHRRDREKNLEKCVSYAEAAAGEHNPHLILLPNYIMQTGLDPVSGPVTERFSELAEKYDVYIAGGMAEAAPDGSGYNTLFLAGPGMGVICFQRKLHLIDMERKKLSEGEGTYKIIDICGAKIGCVLCNDILFPEVARILAVKGAEVILTPSIMAGEAVPVLETICRARAVENQVFVINANAVPLEVKDQYPDMQFGGSGIYSPFHGRLDFARAAGGDEIITAILDLEDLRRFKTSPENPPMTMIDLVIGDGKNLLKDRRPEIYEPLVQEKA